MLPTVNKPQTRNGDKANVAAAAHENVADDDDASVVAIENKLHV